MTARTITREAFRNRPLDVVAFYGLLPTDGWKAANGDAISRSECLVQMHRFAAMDMLQADGDLLDDVIFHLLTQHEPFTDKLLLQETARRACYAFAALLAGEKPNRSLRMRLVQLNFCLRNLLDAGIAMPATEDADLPYRAPWDFLPMPSGAVWITSDEQNVIIENPESRQLFRLGLPSQVDLLEDGRISIGSLYSNGAWLWDGSSPLLIAHQRPVVLCWQQNDILYGIDNRGSVLKLPAGVDAPRETIIKVGEVSKCRRIGNTLYIFDWTVPHQLILLDLDNFRERRITLPEVMLVNDIAATDTHFYLIDKLQGHIFKYDKQFTFIEKRLGLGKGPGQLYDPIALRQRNGRLQVMNWLTSRMVTLPVF